jgi:endonuclease/exonuclease/phosphatase family metal-dependent hydrolase
MESEHAVWTSKEQCQAAVQKGLRMVEPSSSTLRVATWNVRWFPLGSAPDRPQKSAEPTDIDWLICAIQWMQVDIVAIQESLATPEATQAWKRIISQLHTQTGDTWQWYQQPCGRPDNHHIGFLWNDTRVALSDFDSLWQFNAKAQSATNPCASDLRPGHYAYAQSRENEGVDFHLIALHLKSSPTVFAVEKRQKALNRIDQTVKTLLDSDRDVVILGDFNTMGAGDWHSQKSEIKYIRRMVRNEEPGFEDLPPMPQCSHYFRGRGMWLDHILVAKEMKEVTVTSVTVTGYCAIADCQRMKGDYPPAYRQLSDHCPVVLEIENRDID